MLKEFLAYLENEVKNGSIYVWGGQGQQATEALIDRLETSETNKSKAKALLKKREKQGCKNIKAYDCSGLVTKAMEEAGIESKGFDCIAHALYRTYSDKINRSELKPGDLVFRMDSSGRCYHVGVVVDFELHVIEAQGRAYGVVKRDINASGKSYWNACGRPKKLRAEIEKNKKQVVFKRLLKEKLIRMRGEDVKLLQTTLINKGYSCGDCGADGVFGSNTDRAVRRFQADSKLEVDGIAGRNTITKLGLIWSK